MNLENVIALCDRFITLLDDGGLLDKLNAATSISSEDGDTNTASKRDALIYAADSLKTVLKGSLFDDRGLSVIPEFDGLGLSTLIDMSDVNALSEGVKSELLDWAQITELQAALSACSARIGEVEPQLRSLKTVADYFGLEGRDLPEAEAFAVARMPEFDETKPHVDAFVDHIQAFQRVINHCSDVTGNGEASNLRMITGPDAVLVADMTPSAAAKLSSLVSEVGRAQEKAAKIDDAITVLKSQNLPSRIVSEVAKEADQVRTFKRVDAQSLQFWSSLNEREDAGETRELLDVIKELEGDGVHLSAVSLSSNVGDEIRENMSENATASEVAPQNSPEGPQSSPEDLGSVDENVAAAQEQSEEGTSTGLLATGVVAVGATGAALLSTTSEEDTQVTDAVEEVIADVQSAVTEQTTVGSVEVIQTAAVDAVDGISKSASEAVATVGDTLEDATSSVTNKVAELAIETGDVVDVATENVDKLADEVTDKASSTVDDLAIAATSAAVAVAGTAIGLSSNDDDGASSSKDSEVAEVEDAKSQPATQSNGQKSNMRSTVLGGEIFSSKSANDEATQSSPVQSEEASLDDVAEVERSVEEISASEIAEKSDIVAEAPVSTDDASKIENGAKTNNGNGSENGIGKTNGSGGLSKKANGVAAPVAKKGIYRAIRGLFERPN